MNVRGAPAHRIRQIAGVAAAAYDHGMLYGRDDERERIGSLLRAARSSKSGALVVRGEPGIGKSALLEDTRERASDMQVLTARGVEAESELPFAALHQLLRSALPYVKGLPGPQATALRGALGLETVESTERFLVSAACLSLLSELSERRPVLCLVDDAHWLDTATADALLFVARRLDAEGIVMLFGAREGDVRRFDADGVSSLVLDPLDDAASAVLLERTTGVGVAPAVLERLLEQTNGNALALMEVPAALTPAQLAGDAPLPEALPMTRRVEEIFLERFQRLPEQTQRLMLVAAADDSEELRIVLAAAAELGATEKDLDAAEQSGLVSVHGTRIEFRHPLVRSAVYDSATSGQRRAAHKALATSLVDELEHADRHAWHLASSVVDADEEIAIVVEHVADRAEARGAYGSAARTLQRAVDISADRSARVRRLVRAAKAASIAGLDDDAVKLATQAEKFLESPAQRADVVSVLGLVELRRGTPIDAYPMLVQAASDIAATDPAKSIELFMYALTAADQGGKPELELEAARLAMEVVPAVGDDGSQLIGVFLAGAAADLEGDFSRAAELMKPALELAYSTENSYAAFIGSVAALMVGNDVGFETLLTRAISVARDRGQFGVLAEAIALRAAQLLMMQRLDEAAHAADEALQFGREVRTDNHMLMPLGVLAAVAAIRGEDEEARRRADEVLAVATKRRLVVRAALARYALGMIDVGRGRWAEALEHFEPIQKVNTVHAMRVAPDRVEAAIRAGNVQDAREIADAYSAWVAETGSSWGRPRAASCRALVSDGDEATEHFEEAIESIDDARPFDRARIHLLFGEHLRRLRRRADARTHLRAALEEFERFRATPWAERAASELRATGETARKRDPSTFDQLTPQEIHISRLVAQGMSNKEVAAQLFLSPRTIDYHLRNVYSKLGLTSRTQLAHIGFAPDDTPTATAVGAAS